jgi:hypothetical protein
VIRKRLQPRFWPDQEAISIIAPHRP